LELNGTNQLLVYADNINLSSENINVINNKGILLYVSKEVGLKANTEKTKYMILSCYQTAR